MNFKVQTYLNETRGDRFEAFRPETSVLVPGPAFETTVADGAADGGDYEALDFAFAAGNRMRESVLQWPSTVRSISVGDVIVLEGRGAWAVAAMGFEAISLEAVQAAVR